MNAALTGGSLVLAVIAICIAIWQGVMSRQQLELAKTTNSKTEQALADISRVTEENKRIAAELKANFDAKISRVFDAYLTTAERQVEAQERSDRDGREMLQGVAGWFASNFSPGMDAQQLEAEERIIRSAEDDGQSDSNVS